MTFANILYSVEQGVARLTLNRPDKLNSFNVAMHQEVREALGRAVSDGIEKRPVMVTRHTGMPCAFIVITPVLREPSRTWRDGPRWK